MFLCGGLLVGRGGKGDYFGLGKLFGIVLGIFLIFLVGLGIFFLFLECRVEGW